MTNEQKTTKQLLVVDDEPPIVRLVTSLLNKVPEYEVDSAKDGQEALEKLRAGDWKYDLVLTDVQMPRMNGVELIAQVAEEHPETPFIVVTAHRNDKNVIRCLELGAVDYLVKPISVTKLQQTVRRALERIDRFAGKPAELSVKSEMDGWVEITAPTDFEYVERFQHFTSLLGTVPLPNEVKEDIRVAVDELGQNAIEWGNEGDRSKQIRLSFCLFTDRIVFKIQDEGEGFESNTLRDPSADPLAHIQLRAEEGKRVGGYGVFITKKLMDEVVYSEKGNTVLLTKMFAKS